MARHDARVNDGRCGHAGGACAQEGGNKIREAIKLLEPVADLKDEALKSVLPKGLGVGAFRRFVEADLPDIADDISLDGSL